MRASHCAHRPHGLHAFLGCRMLAMVPYSAVVSNAAVNCDVKHLCGRRLGGFGEVAGKDSQVELLLGSQNPPHRLHSSRTGLHSHQQQARALFVQILTEFSVICLHDGCYETGVWEPTETGPLHLGQICGGPQKWVCSTFTDHVGAHRSGSTPP